MTRWVMGIDGGGTGCRAVLADAGGRVLAQAAGGPANVMSDPEKALASVLAVAAEALAGRDGADCAACLGLAGADVAGAGEWMPARLPFARALVVQDAETALAGALGDADGIVAALGTGSVFSRRLGGAVETVGGRGAVLGDEGGGAWLGKRLLARTLRAHDGLERHSPLTRALLAEMGGVPGIIAFARQAGGADFAARARVLAEAPDDPAAAGLLAEADAQIAAYVTRLQPPGEPLAVTFTGGLGPLFAARLAPLWPQREPLGTPLDGALSMAFSLARGVVPGERWRNPAASA